MANTARHGRQARRLENPANGRAADAMADILERPMDPRVASRRILRRHPHDQLTDLDYDTASSQSPDIRPLAGDQLPMPPQQRVPA